ncbi:MAG: MFS transporter [Candidatus Fermentithermobacillus carboniphilus]|uniref:MFS transporter n=1 Tax=Candidatus Fermentithermobacillus carboniphilus TaxID=3085328 RepID=A0AAT9LC14_9FIRM|nr:MAG: MFS transporter [Candidatus Fermentithermobacillus carboniphilus]
MFNIIIAGLTSLLTDISTEMVYPLLPLFLTTRLGASPAIVGIIEGIAESTASILKVFSGAISDKIGKRKPLAIGGYSFSTLGKLSLVFANSWHMVLWGRILDRFGKGIRTAPRDALIAESSHEGERGAAFGLHRLMDSFGASIGIILAYYLVTSYKGDYAKVFLYSVIPAVLGVACLFLIREKPGYTPRENKGFHLSLNWKALDPRLRAFLIATFVFTLGNSSNQFLLLRAENIGVSPSTVILLYLTYNLVYTAVSYPAGKLSDRIGRRTLLVLGYLAYGLVYLGFAFVKSPSALWALFGTYGLYIGFTEGVEKALVSDIAPPAQKATLIGLHATLVGIGLFPASTLAGFLWKAYGPRAPFFFGGAMGLLAAFGLWWVLRDK